MRATRLSNVLFWKGEVTVAEQDLRGRRQSGFTLTEIMIVIIILAILAAIAMPVYLNQRQKARDANAREGGRTIATATQLYILDPDNATDAAPAIADKATLTPTYLAPQEWPQNMYEGREMAIGGLDGDYEYDIISDPKRFVITVHLGSGDDFRVP
jgi:prepilin-type N-terminal cleavage/methylation domain-containing protein